MCVRRLLRCGDGIGGRRLRRRGRRYGFQRVRRKMKTHGGNIGGGLIGAGHEGVPVEQGGILAREEPERIHAGCVFLPDVVFTAQDFKTQARAGEAETPFGSVVKKAREKDFFVAAQPVGQALLRLRLVEETPVRVIGQAGPAGFEPAGVVGSHVFHAAGPCAERQGTGGRAVRQRGVRNLRILAAQRIALGIEGRLFPEQRHRRAVGRCRDQKAAATPPYADFDDRAFPRAGRDDARQQPFRFLFGNADIKTAARRQGLHGGGQRRIGGQHAARAHVEPQKRAEGMMRRAAPVQRLRGAEQGVRFLYVHVVLSGAQGLFRCGVLAPVTCR